MKQALRKIVIPYLNAEGFVGDIPNLHRMTTSFIHKIYFGFSSDSKAFNVWLTVGSREYLDKMLAMGVAFPEIAFKDSRVFNPNLEQIGGHWWLYGDRPGDDFHIRYPSLYTFLGLDNDRFEKMAARLVVAIFGVGAVTGILARIGQKQGGIVAHLADDIEVAAFGHLGNGIVAVFTIQHQMTHTHTLGGKPITRSTAACSRVSSGLSGTFTLSLFLLPFLRPAGLRVSAWVGTNLACFCLAFRLAVAALSSSLRTTCITSTGTDQLPSTHPSANT